MYYIPISHIPIYKYIITSTIIARVFSIQYTSPENNYYQLLDQIIWRPKEPVYLLFLISSQLIALNNICKLNTIHYKNANPPKFFLTGAFVKMINGVNN